MIDAIWVNFIKENPYTFSAVFGILWALAKASPWTWDENILNIIVAPFKNITDMLYSEPKE